MSSRFWATPPNSPPPTVRSKRRVVECPLYFAPPIPGKSTATPRQIPNIQQSRSRSPGLSMNSGSFPNLLNPSISVFQSSGPSSSNPNVTLTQMNPQLGLDKFFAAPGPVYPAMGAALNSVNPLVRASIREEISQAAMDCNRHLHHEQTKNGKEIRPPSCPTASDSLDTSQPWASLFKKTPKNASRYSPKHYDKIECYNGVTYPPQFIIDASSKYWEKTLVGFFLDDGFDYATVRSHLRRRWRLKGKIKMRFDKQLFFFDFTNDDDRCRILIDDPIVIEGKVFIIMAWSPSIDTARDHVKSIPVWTKIYNIPSCLQPLDGLDWIASHIGRPICFDESTTSRDRLDYAKALIEISASRMPPSRLTVCLPDNSLAYIDIIYQWKPKICTLCQSFGHEQTSCHHRDSHASVSLPTNNRTNPAATVPVSQATATILGDLASFVQIGVNALSHAGLEPELPPSSITPPPILPTNHSIDMNKTPTEYDNGCLLDRTSEGPHEHNLPNGMLESDVLNSTHSILTEKSNQVCSTQIPIFESPILNSVQDPSFKSNGCHISEQVQKDPPNSSAVSEPLNQCISPAGSHESSTANQSSFAFQPPMLNGSILPGTLVNTTLNNEVDDLDNGISAMFTNVLPISGIASQDAAVTKSLEPGLNTTPEGDKITFEPLQNRSVNTTFESTPNNIHVLDAAGTVLASVNASPAQGEKLTILQQSLKPVATQGTSSTDSNYSTSDIRAGEQPLHHRPINVRLETSSETSKLQFVTSSSANDSDSTAADLNEELSADNSLPKHDILWYDTERAWVHVQSDMHYSPACRTFYRHVSNDPLEERFLFYRPDKNALVLASRRKYAKHNEKILLDTDWDRENIYNEQSVGYSDVIVKMFRHYQHVFGNVEMDSTPDCFRSRYRSCPHFSFEH